MWNLAGHQGSAVYAIAFPPAAAGALMATGGSDRTAKLWDVSTDVPRVKWTLGGQRDTGHSGTIYRVAFDGLGKRLATASYDGTAMLWDVATGKPLRRFCERCDQLRDVAFSADGAFLAIASADGFGRLYSLVDESAAPIPIVHGEDKNRVVQVSAVALDPDPKRPAAWITAGWDGVLRRWDRDGNDIGKIPRSRDYPKDSRITRLAFTRKGTEIAALIGAGVYFWPASRFDHDDGREPRVLKFDHAGRCLAMAFSPDDTLLAVGCNDGAVRVYRNDAGNQALVKTVRVHHNWVMDVAFSADGTTLSTASLDGTFQRSPLRFDDLYALAVRRQQHIAGGDQP
jgi:WD40 repeat protein